MIFLSKAEHDNFGKKLACHTAPTLLGIKCASLFSLSSTEFDIDSHSEYFNRKAAAKGLKCKVLCSCMERRLVLIYNEKLLEKRLADISVHSLLAEYGYSQLSFEECISRLGKRIAECESFPHEIGIFLDYPVEDVRGFIANQGENFKICGAWKVYGSVEKARRTFANYDKCRNFLCNKLNEGADIYQALRIS